MLRIRGCHALDAHDGDSSRGPTELVMTDVSGLAHSFLCMFVRGCGFHRQQRTRCLKPNRCDAMRDK